MSENLMRLAWTEGGGGGGASGEPVGDYFPDTTAVRRPPVRGWFRGGGRLRPARQAPRQAGVSSEVEELVEMESWIRD